ncbi:hypothetical protein [Undibacterium sp. YM2]|uniref:hypothetical protein n=1 Tax=Undibacterium sp. YM2 TaxID=2058625 RepID=UPI0013893AC8|nr:hypothetical protein [Undibacterium sp. YM2]
MEIKDNEKSSDQPFVDMANRGISFTLILVVLTIAAIAMVVVYGLSWQRLIFLYPRWSAYCLLIASLLRLLAIAGIWRWKKIAVILYSLIAMTTTPPVFDRLEMAYLKWLKIVFVVLCSVVTVQNRIWSLGRYGI